MEKLKDELLKNDMNYQNLADLLGISIRAVQYKMAGINDFKSSEIAIIKKKLKLSDKRTAEIFF